MNFSSKAENHFYDSNIWDIGGKMENLDYNNEFFHSIPF
jgi:hypothetical protein